MEEETSAFGSLPKLVSHNDLLELRTLIQQTQVDLLSSIETLKSRIFDLETKLTIQSSKSSEPEREREGAKEISYNVFDFVSREELGIEEHKEPEIDYKDDEIRVIESGFTAPPPEDNLPEGPEKWAENIIGEINETGGSMSLYWKRRGLIPDDISETQKVSVKKILENKGIQTYKVNTFRHFYYVGTEEEGEEKYGAYSE